MKDKLKAIWRIMRSKSYFYAVHVGDEFVSDFEIGNQPKGGVPAFVRASAMFDELHNLTVFLRVCVNRMSDRYHNPQFKD